MLKSYLLIAYRSLIRNKEYSIINVVGLAVSIASCLVLAYVIHYELSFDTFHKNKDRIYRITNEVKLEEGMDYGEGVPAPLPDAMRLDFPQISQVGTIFSIPNSQIDVMNGKPENEIQFREELGVFFAEPQFFKIFDFGWLHGSPEVLLEPNVAVLTQETAEKYFGTWENAIGKSIEYRNSNALKVNGILKNIPSNTDFPMKVVISFKTRGQENPNWGSITSRRQCYILLDGQNTADQIASQMPAFEKKHQPADRNIRDHYTLQPLKDLHFDSRFGNFNNRIASKRTLMSLALIGLLLIITASINFVNLAIAQVMKRSKEVGVRKVLGSSRWQLSGQFFGETLLILLFSSVVALMITQISLPYIRTILNLPAAFPVMTPLQIMIFISGIILVIMACSGFYPARILAALKPDQALKNKVTTQTVGGVSVRKGLVVVQFTIAQILVISTLVVFQQLDFFRKSPLGFDQESIVLFSVPVDSLNRSKYQSFRNELMKLSEIKQVSFNFNPPLSESNRRVSFRFNNAAQQAPFEVNIKYADVEYFKTYDLSLVSGRIYKTSDTASEFLVNETFLKKFGIQNPEEGLGKTITMNNRALPIVGVLKDFHLHTLQDKIEPLVMQTNRNQYQKASVKLQTNDLKEISQKIETVYRSSFPGNIFEYQFFDESVARQYAEEQRLSAITRIFSAMAILISSLGLYGLISFMAVQRLKEVGIRKVLGASVSNILFLFYKEFVVLVLIAFLVSAPLTGYLMSDWLNNFEYKINLSPRIFILGITLSIAIAMFTISFKSIKAALSNPVTNLRND